MKAQEHAACTGVPGVGTRTFQHPEVVCSWSIVLVYTGIMDSVKVDYSKYDTIKILPNVGFDWYVTLMNNGDLVCLNLV